MASRFAHFGTAVLFRSSAGASFIPKPSPSSSLRPSLRFFPRLSCTSSELNAVLPAVGQSEAAAPPHPWPEWVDFVDRLTAKGYFGEKSGSSLEESDGEKLYQEMELVKDACLTFARDRYDILKSLPRKDIEVVVGGGCPNLLRKAVNSAKRLRAYISLDEGDVCSACNLRGSCDRAYVILKEPESEVRTLDIVRVLLFYALDPNVISGLERPFGRELVESSARNLLSELLRLSETARDPELAKPASQDPKKKVRPPPSSVDDHQMVEKAEMKRGDWMCPKCNYLNFSRNLQCLKCKEDGPKSVPKPEIVMTKGDWACPMCSFLNFSRNRQCLKCETERPKRPRVDEVEMKKGDWNCPQCQFMNFASNKNCLRCKETRPKRLLNPGEWECPSCDFLNYRRNKSCLKCNVKQPKETVISDYEEQIWRRPR